VDRRHAPSRHVAVLHPSPVAFAANCASTTAHAAHTAIPCVAAPPTWVATGPAAQSVLLLWL